VRHLVIYAFFALKDSRTLLNVTALMIPVNVALDLALVRLFSYVGLALGMAVSAFLHLALLLWLLRGKAGPLQGAKVLKSLLRCVAASAAMLAVVLPLKAAFPLVALGSPSLERALSLGVAVAAGGAVYLFVAAALRAEEIGLVWRAVRSER
jgi:putative peptidoglycan lipid II flippase